MDQSNTCVFSTSNNSEYALESLSRLEQARKHMHYCPAYLIGSTFSYSIKVVAKAKDITLIEVGETNPYFDKEWEYPKECYFWALAPLYIKREKYAIYIDGDVFCLKNPYLNLEEYPVNSIAGITLDLVPGVTDKEIRLYSKKYTFDMNRPRVNSGVLYMNLDFLRNINFTKSMSDLYHWSIKQGIPRKGDDSLFWVFVKTHDYDWTYLPQTYNWIRTRFGEPPMETVWFHNNKA